MFSSEVCEAENCFLYLNTREDACILTNISRFHISGVCITKEKITGKQQQKSNCGQNSIFIFIKPHNVSINIVINTIWKVSTNEPQRN